MSHDIRCICTTAELLSAIDAFEQIGCAFGAATNAHIRAVKRNPHGETFEFRDATFEMAPFWRNVLVLSHAAKPIGPGGSNSVRPFAELLVTHGIQRVRLVAEGHYTAWLEVSIQEGRWRKLTREGPPAAPEPPPVTVIEERIPAPRLDLEAKDP